MADWRIIVCTSDDYSDMETIKDKLDCWNISEIIHSGHGLIDSYAADRGIPVKVYSDRDGYEAGDIRNRKMIERLNESSTGKMIAIFDHSNSDEYTKSIVDMSEDYLIDVLTV